MPAFLLTCGAKGWSGCALSLLQLAVLRVKVAQLLVQLPWMTRRTRHGESETKHKNEQNKIYIQLHEETTERGGTHVIGQSSLHRTQSIAAHAKTPQS
jgi:hypothetical protein